MKINSKLKKEGIKIIEKLDTLKVNKIANNVAAKLCLAFPEHDLNKSELFESLARLNMYIATMPNNFSGAKYFYKENAIYFSESSDIETMSTVAVHECIHCIQEIHNRKLIRMGLYTPSSNNGLSLNEAAVQLMASEANKSNLTCETYYGISINTISPDYYPLQCLLLNQLTYFTGTYPLYYSTLYSNDVFKNTFVLKSSEKTYIKISKNFDKILNLESNLNFYSSELQYTDKPNEIELLSRLINETKNEIKSVFFNTQNTIINKCFKKEFNNIKNIEDIKNFKSKLYNFKDKIGTVEEYTFYNDFYRKMMNAIEEKQAYIEKNGEINIFDNTNTNTNLMIIDNTKNIFSFINTLISKIKKVFTLNNNYKDINDWQE